MSLFGLTKFKVISISFFALVFVLAFQNCDSGFEFDESFLAGTSLNSSVENSNENDHISYENTPATEVELDISEEPETGWPKGTNGKLPMAGIFYGNYDSGMHTGNAQISLDTARRFRAEKSGYITAVRHNNRILHDSNIKNRCVASNPNSVWCKCLNAGLDKFTCGYTLSNSYSVGNGGSIIVEVREDDGTSLHRPSNVVLGKTKVAFVPMENENSIYPILELDRSVKIVAGRLYHLVYVNLNPPTTCALSAVSINAAKNCPRNQGAVGLNGVTHGIALSENGYADPFRGSSGLNLQGNSKTGKWSTTTDKLSWYELRYADETWVGDSYAAYGGTSSGRNSIGGNVLARQKFTVEDTSRHVNGLWLMHGPDKDRSSDGSAMHLVLKNSKGSILATGSLPAVKTCFSKVQIPGSWLNQNCRGWTYSDLSQPIMLNVGQTYTVEFKASVAGGFSLGTVFPLDYSVYDSQSRNTWPGAQAEISRDGGKSWQGFSGTYYAKRDLSLLFTLVGMPKSMP